jgi:hypothetical protein
MEVGARQQLGLAILKKEREKAERNQKAIIPVPPKMKVIPDFYPRT